MRFNKLKGARAEKGYSQVEMAEKLEMSVDSYNQKENGKSEFKLSEVKNLLEILDKEFNDIFLEYCSILVELRL